MAWSGVRGGWSIAWVAMWAEGEEERRGGGGGAGCQVGERVVAGEVEEGAKVHGELEEHRGGPVFEIPVARH
jgi:hypothetical protein